LPYRPNGVAVGSGLLAGDLFVNTQEGVLVEVNLGTKARTELATGGSRGDMMSVDGNSGTLLLTQTHSIVRLRPPGGGSFAGGDMAGTFMLTSAAQAAGFTVSTFATGFPSRPYYPGPTDQLGPMGIGF